MLTRRHKNSGRQNDGLRWPAHRKWVRGFTCLCMGRGGECWGDIECAHVDYATPKGMGLKGHDAFTVPLCAAHHAEQHTMGWQAFEAKYGIDAEAKARRIMKRSPKWGDMRLTLPDLSDA